MNVGAIKKRFWSEVAVAEADGGHAIHLDGRPVRTPAKSLFVAPVEAVAKAAAEEWRAQGEDIRPETMPVTRAVNTSIDRVAPQLDEIRAIVAEYGKSDLLCYRVTGPADLVRRQAAHWDHPLAWASETLGARLVLAEGVMHVEQSETALTALTGRVGGYSPLELTALHDLVAISGSLVLGLGVAEGAMAAEAAWAASRVDENWQIELWGEDAEAAEAAANKRAAFLDAARLFDLLKGEGAP